MTATAAGPIKGLPVDQDTSNARYATDLVGSDRPKKLYAARVLKRRVRTAWKVAARPGADLHTLEARQTLSEFDTLVAPRCIRQLADKATRKECAAILGFLETPEALDPLRTQLDDAPSWCERRALERALKRVEQAQ